jgi:ribonuclease P protein component
VAFITPKKLGEAVVRNRLRRQLREIYRRHLPLLASRPPSDLIVLAKSEALKLDFSALERNFLELYAKLAEKVKSS